MAFCREKNQKLLFKVDSLLNFRKWFMYGLKAQKLIAQGIARKQHALKGQKLLAQGSALGIKAISMAPCKGKSLINFRVSFKAFALTGRQVCEHDNPGRCPGLRSSAPSGRAACVLEPWVNCFCPFRACGEKLAKLESFFKENVPLNTPMYPYVPTAN